MNDYLGRLALRGRGELEVARPVTTPAFLPETTNADQEEEDLERRPLRQRSGPAHSPPSVSPTSEVLEAARRTSQVAAHSFRPADEGEFENGLAEGARPPENGPAEVAPAPHNSDRGASGNENLNRVGLPEALPGKGLPEEGDRVQQTDQGRAGKASGLERQNIVKVERIEPRPGGRPARSEMKDQSGGEGSIHISIGRVEVRAIMPSPPAPPAPPAQAQRLSLDEYLRARKERRKG